ncbi:MAG: hypothetical protein AB1758_03700 [Candidatus Eremiobacterota bacterium]
MRLFEVGSFANGLLRSMRQAQPAAGPVDRVQLDLTQGTPFEASDAVVLTTGLNLTREGLQAVYSQVAPGTRVYVDNLVPVEGGFQYEVSWRDNLGGEVAHTELALVRHPDGALEGHRFNSWTDPAVRGQGIMLRALEAELGLLGALSDHPDTRHTLRAGGTAVHGKDERLGTYTWARMGFDFAPPQFQSRVIRYAGRGPHDDVPGLNDVGLLRRQFGRWIAERCGDRPELLAALNEAVAKLRHPWEFANFRVPGLRVGEPPMDLGKAFLTSELATQWDAVFMVNRPSPGHEVFRLYRDETSEKAEKLVRQASEATAEALFSPDVEVQRSALEKILRLGTPEWMPHLERVAAICPPELAPLLQEARAAVQGHLIQTGIRDLAEDDRAPVLERLSAIHNLADLEGEADLNLYRETLTQGSATDRWWALMDVVQVEGKERPREVSAEVARMLEETPPTPWDGMVSQVRHEGIRSLGRLDGPGNARRIFEAGRQGDGTDRRVAREVLADIPGLKAAFYRLRLEVGL